MLAPVWIAGLVRWRRPALRAAPVLRVAWVVLAMVFLATGGKPYYLAGMFPVLLAAGAIETRRVAAIAAHARRGRAARAAVALSARCRRSSRCPSCPASDAGPVDRVNRDAGRRSAGPTSRAPSRAVYDAGAAGRAVIFTSNYGEAGAIDRYGPAFGLPRRFSGHNGFGDWGPPRTGAGPVVAVGMDTRTLAGHFRAAGSPRGSTTRPGSTTTSTAARSSLRRAARPWSPPGRRSAISADAAQDQRSVRGVSRIRSTRAGTPAADRVGGMSFVTTLLVPIDAVVADRRAAQEAGAVADPDVVADAHVALVDALLADRALDLDDAVVEVDQHHAVGDDALAADRDVLEGGDRALLAHHGLRADLPRPRGRGSSSRGRSTTSARAAASRPCRSPA